MADNETALMQWQLGTQTQFDTAVTPTVKLMGINDGSLTPHVQGSHIDEQRGDLTPAFNTTLDSKSGEGELSFDVSFEDVCYWLDMHFAKATPSGAGPYSRVYTGAGPKPASRIATLVRGSALDAKKLVGALAGTLELSASKNERWKGKVGLLGHSVVDGALAALSDRIVNYAHANNTTIYVDPAGGSFGATPLTLQNHSFTLSLDAAKSLKMGIGSPNPVDNGQNKADPGANTLTLSMALDTASIAWMDTILNTTQANGLWSPLVRVKSEISSSLSLMFDFAGWAPEAPAFVVDEDGVASLEFTLNPIYDSTLGSWIKFTSINGVASLA